MGIRKKISLGFLCLGVMLAFSVMISMFELLRMGRNTRDLLATSSLNMEYSQKMLEAVHDQNTSLLQRLLTEQPLYDSLFAEDGKRFDQALGEASRTREDSVRLAPVRMAREEYYRLVDSFFGRTEDTDTERFLGEYKSVYHNLVSSINDYTAYAQHMLMEKAAQLGHNAYRAITPGIISLMVAIVMLFMFAFLIDLYYTGPTVRITRGLRDYTTHNIPFNVKMEGRDEIQKLREYIETLISMYKNKKA